MGGVTERGIQQSGTVWQGNVSYLNLNPTYRNLNLNAFDNDWNENCEFLAVRDF